MSGCTTVVPKNMDGAVMTLARRQEIDEAIEKKVKEQDDAFKHAKMMAKQGATEQQIEAVKITRSQLWRWLHKQGLSIEGGQPDKRVIANQS